MLKLLIGAGSGDHLAHRGCLIVGGFSSVIAGSLPYLRWQLLGFGLFGGNWGSHWPPFRETTGREDVLWHFFNLKCTRTYRSQHHNRAVISLLYSTGCFSKLLFFNTQNLSETYASRDSWMCVFSCVYGHANFLLCHNFAESCKVPDFKTTSSVYCARVQRFKPLNLCQRQT